MGPARLGRAKGFSPLRDIEAPPRASAESADEEGGEEGGEEADEEEPERTTKLHIDVSDSERCALRISMGSINSMEDLQELVAEVCEEAGYQELDDLVMSYKRPGKAEYTLVTRSVTVEMLKASDSLRLAPASRSAASSASKSASATKGGTKGVPTPKRAPPSTQARRASGRPKRR